jgi:hypothetical protein
MWREAFGTRIFVGINEIIQELVARAIWEK